jgi:hypothetical protein
MPVQKYDNAGLGLAKQSARGTPATTFKFAKHYQTITKMVERATVQTGAALGSGHAVQKEFNSNNRVLVTAQGVTTLDSLTAHLFKPLGSKAAATTVATTGKSHVFSAGQISTEVDLFTLAILVQSRWNSVGSVFTTPALIFLVRDCVMTALSYNFSINTAPSWTKNYSGSNEGPGDGSETYALDTNYHMINPSGATTLVLNAVPDWFPAWANLCAQSIGVEFGFDTVEVQCLNSGEPQFTSVVNQATITIVMTYDVTYAQQIYNWVNGLKATRDADLSNLEVGIMEGQFDFTASGIDSIAGSAPDTKYSMRGYFPSLQWATANIALDADVNTLTVVAKTFATDFTHTVVNGLLDAAMTL